MELVTAYVRADFPEVEEIEFAALARSLAESVARIGREWATRTRGEDGFELLYDFDQGSLRTRARIVGTLLLGTYVAISQYPDFRKGIIQLYEDCRHAGQSIVEEFKNVTGVKDDDVRYQRTTPRDVNRLLRIVRNVERPVRTIPDTVRRDEIIADIARLYHQNHGDPTIQQLLHQLIEILRKDEIPQIPPQLEDILAEDEKKRRKLTEHREVRGRYLVPGDRPRPRIRRLHYHTTLRI